jgi:cell division protein FtsB
MSADSQPFDIEREKRIRKKVGHWKGRELDLLREIERLEAENKRKDIEIEGLNQNRVEWSERCLKAEVKNKAFLKGHHAYQGFTKEIILDRDKRIRELETENVFLKSQIKGLRENRNLLETMR